MADIVLDAMMDLRKEIKIMKRIILASSTSDVVKFEVGETYTASMLYGGRVSYTVVDRTADSVTLSESHVSEDDGHVVSDDEETYPVVLQDMYDDSYTDVIGKQESVLLWEYKGHKGYLYAGNN